MASKASATIALLFSLNLLFFSMANATYVQLSACANVDVNVCNFGLLGGLGLTEGCQCCGLIQSLIEANADVCLCAILNANILGINLSAAAQLVVLLETCGLPAKTCSC